MDYARLILAAYQDWRLFVLQALNVGKTVLRVINNFLLATPHLVFWGVVTWVIYDPADLFAAVAMVRQASPEELGSAVRTIIGFLPSLILIGFVLNGLIFNAWFGLTNVFVHRVFQDIRKHVGASADGKITISRVAIAADHVAMSG